MLKYKVTKNDINESDMQTLEITKVERQDFVSTNVSDGTYGVTTENVDEVVFKFWAKNIYTLQDGIHLLSSTSVLVNNDEKYPEEGNTINYLQEVIVSSASKVDNSFTFAIDKELKLEVENLYIETVYHAFILKDNNWKCILVDKQWIEDNFTDYDDCKIISTSEAPYGKSLIYENKKTLFYYENSEWKNISLIDTKDEETGKIHYLEDCIKGDKIDLSSIHEYDNIERDAIELEENVLYITRENYITIDTYSTHYFGNPIIEYEEDETSRTESIKKTKFDKEIVKSIKYPSIYLYVHQFNGATLFPTDIKIKVECNVVNEKRLIFNYDNFQSEAQKWKPWYILPNAKKYIKDTEYILQSEISPIPVGSVVDKVYSLEKTDVNSIFDVLFPYGLELITFEPIKDITRNLIQKSKEENPILKAINSNAKYHSIQHDGAYVDISAQGGYVNGVVYKRDNLMYDEFDGNSFDLLFNKAYHVIQIPFSQKFCDDMYHNDALKTNFIDASISAMINPILDMEKDVYLPAIHNSNIVDKKDGTYTQINAPYKDCNEIVFNLHFRQHRDKITNGVKQEWQCDKDSYWNGTKVLEQTYEVDNDKVTKKIIDLNGRIYNYKLDNADTTESNKTDYFSYFGVLPTDEATPSNGFDSFSEGDLNDYDVLGKKYGYDTYKNLRDNRSLMTEYQSDALSYLGFSNDDVKYQKSKLKKSFLRISFYDSDNIGNQNLLATSTIFLDSGNLFAKYIKNINTEEEYKLTGDATSIDGIKYKKDAILNKFEFDRLSVDKNGNSYKKKCVVNGQPMAVVNTSFIEDEKLTVYNKNGVRVNREPMRNNAISKTNKANHILLSDNIEYLEQFRLSSQFTVKDKYSSKNSSEGFYFYNYKTNDNGVFPSEIYMRVEFNHAGYGRTIPFMMPYIREGEEEVSKDEPGYYRYAVENREDKIKTFDDICYDWSEVDFDRAAEEGAKYNIKDGKYLKEEDKIGYGSIRYMKYCHIKFKYRYDKDTQKHIYYLDPDLYGTGATTSNGHGNNIILNLYEGKIS